MGAKELNCCRIMERNQCPRALNFSWIKTDWSFSMELSVLKTTQQEADLYQALCRASGSYLDKEKWISIFGKRGQCLYAGYIGDVDTYFSRFQTGRHVVVINVFSGRYVSCILDVKEGQYQVYAETSNVDNINIGNDRYNA